LAKRSESSSGQLFNPWVGRRKRNGWVIFQIKSFYDLRFIFLYRKDKASALWIKMDDGGHQEPSMIATDNFWTAFGDKIKQNYYPYMQYYSNITPKFIFK